jgi:excisionase family DNA binding protein
LTKTTRNIRDLDNLISQVEAARLRGVSKQAIANLIKRGRLTTTTVAGRTLLLRSEVESFVAQPKLGRPPKKDIKINSRKK